MTFLRKLAMLAALTVAFLFGTASQGYAQATPIAGGHLTAGPTISNPASSIVELTFNLVELPDGSVVGSGKSTKQATGAWYQFDITSYMFVGDGILMMAGTVTAVHDVAGFVSVGSTVFYAVKDNGNGGGPVLDQFIDGVVPAIFGPVTIQQIFAFTGVPPAEIFREGLNGNFKFH